MPDPTLDCVVIGYHEPAFTTVFEQRHGMFEDSGAYRNLLNNSVIVDGRRLTYMDLLNVMLEEVTGRPMALNAGKLPNLGACYLKSFLSRRGFRTEMVNFFTAEQELLETLLQRGTRAVAITTTFYVEPTPIIEIVRWVRAHSSSVRIIVGGPHMQDVFRLDGATQQYLFEYMGGDIYIHDPQGEATLAAVLAVLRDGPHEDLASVPNLAFRAELAEAARHVLLPVYNPAQPPAAKFRLTPPEREANSLDENVIDWNLFPRSLYAPTVQVRTARSCAYKCSFCRFPILAGPLALSSIHVVEAELRQLHEAGVRNVLFIDDTFNVPLPRFKQILRMLIANRFDFEWFSFFRCAESDDECYRLMADSGCKGVFLGIESGDQQVLNNMDKHASVGRYKEGIRKLNQAGIMSLASFIIGFPGETRSTVQSTIDFLQETAPTFYRAEIYYHSDKFPIQKQAVTYGLEGGGYTWRHNTMDWRTACDMVDLIYSTVTNSVICPLYMFDFWSMPYLHGMGVSLEHIRTFARVAQKLLVMNFDASPGCDRVRNADIRGELVAICREIASDMALAEIAASSGNHAAACGAHNSVSAG